MSEYFQRWGRGACAALAATLLVASCGEGEGATTVSPCEASNAFPVWGKRYVAERGCIDTETPIENVGCDVRAERGTPEPYPDVGFHCVRRLADGAVFWAFASADFEADTSLFELCDDDSGRPPVACFAEGCADVPQSSCSLEETRKQFGCNAEGGYDERCCGRPTCEEDADCADSEECRSVSIGRFRQCWDNPGVSCECAGPSAAFMEQRCVPRSAP